MANFSFSSVMLFIVSHDSSWSTEVSTNLLHIFPGRNLFKNLCEFGVVCCGRMVCAPLVSVARG